MFTKTIGVLCCCGPDWRWCRVVVAQIGGGFFVVMKPRSVVLTPLSLPHPHSFPLSKVDLEVFSLGFLWI